MLVNVVYGDTDSLYISYDRLFETIEGADSWDHNKKTQFLEDLHKKFLDKRNKESMEAYYKSRGCRSMPHEFELETIASSGIWLNVKKRYAQLLAWQDGKFFDENELKFKAKGLEVIKSSYPPLARKWIKELIDTILRTDGNILEAVNYKCQEAKMEWEHAYLLDICPTTKVSNYHSKIVNNVPVSGCPFSVKGAHNYNQIVSNKQNGVYGDPLYSGRVQYYIMHKSSRKQDDRYICFRAGEYVEGLDRVAPINRKVMFEKCVMDPINRILEAMELGQLNYEGYLVIDLFGF